MSINNWRILLLAVTASAGLAACSPEDTVVKSGSPSPSQNNSPPAIGGAPATQATAGAAYVFQPTASDSDGDALTFTASGLPSWASFNGQSGRISGTPGAGDVGTSPTIVVQVSDGVSAASLPGFRITVAPGSQPPPPPPADPTGTAELSWTAPTQNTDGSPLTDLAGYFIYHGTNSNNLQQVAEVQDAQSTSHTVRALASGTHYFAVTAYNSSRVESARSAVGSKIIP
jgi:hypothetical protein